MIGSRAIERETGNLGQTIDDGSPFGLQAQDIVSGNAQTSNSRFAAALNGLEGDSALLIHGLVCGSRPYAHSSPLLCIRQMTRSDSSSTRMLANSWPTPSPHEGFVVRICGQGFVVRRDWNFAKSGKPAAIFQKLYRSEDPAKRSSQTEGNVSSPSTRSRLSFP